jgi:threonine dehydrogenase-like Zn-dependent dehydrogenase
MRAAVLRDGRLEVRETADPVPGPGELLIKPLSAAICASDVHYMDHPNSAPRFAWDSDRDTIMGHEFMGEVVGHGPDCSGDFPIGSRVTSLPLLIRHGAEPRVIGHDPDAPGAFGELMLVSEVLARTVPDGVPNDAVAVVDAFAVGEFYVRSSAIGPDELPLVIGAGAIGLSAVAALVARGVTPIIVSDYSAERLDYAKKFGADVLVNPAERSPYEVWREVAQDKKVQKPQVIFECVGAPGLLQNIVGSCEFLARVFAAGGWHGSDSVSVTEATHKGVTIQFGGGPHPVDWYGTLDAVTEGRLDPLPSIGKVIGLDEVPAAIDQARKSQGPPRVVVHPAAAS